MKHTIKYEFDDSSDEVIRNIIANPRRVIEALKNIEGWLKEMDRDDPESIAEFESCVMPEVFFLLNPDAVWDGFGPGQNKMVVPFREDAASG